MAGQVKLLTTTFIVDNAVNRYEAIVQGTTAHHAAYATTDNTGLFLGVTDGAFDSGQSAAVVMSGTTWVTAGGAINVGDGLIVAANGQVKTATGVTGAIVIGHALEAAAAAGDQILVKLA